MATASVVRNWLLLEQPGPWGPTALQQSQLPRGLGAELARRAIRCGVRIVLIRRAGRTVQGQPIACYAAATGPGREPWLGRLMLDAPSDVLDVDLGALTAGSRAAFEAVTQPLICVCTHGRHDPCCAERGRPVAAALAARFPECVWEVSHIGGDRFAANAVIFPDGDYLGRLDADCAVPVVEDYLDGRYDLARLRGRAGYPLAAQAAELLVRQRLGIDQRGAISSIDVRQSDGGHSATVRLSVDGHGDLLAKIDIRRAPPSRKLTCHAAATSSPPAYTLRSLISGRE